MAKVITNHMFKNHGAKTEIDKAVLAMTDELFAGVRKIMPEATKLLKSVPRRKIRR